MKNNSEIIVDTLAVIDLDRTLLKTDLAFDKFVGVCAASGYVDITALSSAREHVESSRGSFNVMTHLSNAGISQSQIKELGNSFGNDEDPSLVYDDAQNYLDWIDTKKNWASMIMTYGSSAWQIPKLRTCGLGSRLNMITDQKAKGGIIKSWQTGPELYRVHTPSGLITAKRVTIVDDNPFSFYQLPEETTGFLIDRQGEYAGESRPADLPFNVQVVSGFIDVIDHLESES